ncbi:MAG: phosphoribosylamine--glycine ligase [Myxococcota bacterium]
MQVLVIGSGGREHALAWKIAQSPRVERVLVAPGNDGMRRDATCFPEIGIAEPAALLELAQREAVELVVIGPEQPLADGLADQLREQGLCVFGPSAAATRLEASKTFAKKFMHRHGIPTARSVAFDDLAAARAHVRALGEPCVIKADGLAAGKGVAMCETSEQAESALLETMEERRFGDAGASVVIEEWLQGEEASYHVITDGERIATLAATQDHKRALDGDLGENTGGMGAYSPAPVLNSEVEERVLNKIVRPVIHGMAAEGHPYTGVLYVGLMIDPDGQPRVVEFNVRFGDPETQPLMVRMEGDLLPLLDGAARGRLGQDAVVGWQEAAVCVVLASEGYPRAYQTGKTIQGLADLESSTGMPPDLVVFHAGTRRAADGSFETAGGRVLGVTARASDVRAARDRAYAGVAKIHFEGLHYRRDIAARALER